MNELMPVITDAALTLSLALLSLLAAYVVRGVNAFTAKVRAETVKLEDDQFRSYADEALARVDDLAAKTVTQIEQTTAAALREAIKDGKADRVELLTLGRLAVADIMDKLSADYKDAIAKTVGDVETYVTKAVETKVYELKQGFLTFPAETIVNVS